MPFIFDVEVIYIHINPIIMFMKVSFARARDRDRERPGNDYTSFLTRHDCSYQSMQVEERFGTVVI